MLIKHYVVVEGQVAARGIVPARDDVVHFHDATDRPIEYLAVTRSIGKRGVLPRRHVETEDIPGRAVDRAGGAVVCNRPTDFVSGSTVHKRTVHNNAVQTIIPTGE